VSISIYKCRAVGSNFRPVQPLPKVVCAELFFHLHFSVVRIGSQSNFVLCTALLIAEYAEGDRVQSEGQQHPQAL